MEFFADIGTSMSRFIFWGSSFLTKEQAPGLVSIGILIWLLLSVLVVGISAHRKLTSLRWLEGQVRAAKDEFDFATQVNKISQEVKKVRARTGYTHITAAWDEFRETMIEDKSAGQPVLRNSVRPSSFFNLEDLHFGPGFSRYMPGLFVTVGLFLTFLGLISALQQITGLSDASPEEMRASLDGLLGAASAKFIMSLTGLLASIIFTIVLRSLTGRVERRIHTLCAELESRLSFISLEGVAMEQLEIARGQKDSFLEIGTTLVAELGSSLKKEIPESISSSISTAMAPLLDKVGEAGADGVGQMVTDLSSRFSDDVGRALSDASAQLSAAGDKIASLSDRMDRSSGQMGEEMETSVAKLARAAEDLSAGLASAAQTTDGTLNAGAEKLLGIMNETLEGIRRNTAEGADALKEAAADMRASAGTFREELDAAAASGSDAVRSRMETAGVEVEGAISEAGRGMVDLVTRSGHDLLSASGEFRESIQADLLEPITLVVGQLDEMADRLKDGSVQIATAAGHIKSGGDATRSAAETLTTASRDLQVAAGPVRSSVERIETATTGLAKSTANAAETVTRSSRETAENAARVLDAAKAALSAEQKLIETSLTKLGEGLDHMERQREQIDDMDDKLGAAFNQFASHVRTSLDTFAEHVRKMNGELAPALDTMREIVDQAEKFRPEQRR
ncbi:Biopolymer transport protein ExbB/TolQ [Shimia haliotis]|uniref:Biopolymer transport protein ExbB/TolQ n=2 Tax=Shimia haliotis TaxID=1280847 RepID=A0A1I4CCV6_9RHOB|nr:Biopolymer transport protein ExbB/TolQ [Shimia haliotis]